MIGISSLMFLIATLHLTINAYRMVAGYVNHALLQGGAVAYMGDLRSWHYILKDTLYATQENLGSAAAVSSRSHFIPHMPTVLLSSLDLPLLGPLGPQLEDHHFPFSTIDCKHWCVHYF